MLKDIYYTTLLHRMLSDGLVCVSVLTDFLPNVAIIRPRGTKLKRT